MEQSEITLSASDAAALLEHDLKHYGYDEMIARWERGDVDYAPWQLQEA